MIEPQEATEADSREFPSEVDTELTADVLVIGAGAAGLMAADTLAAAGQEVVLLEARDRVGGRTWSQVIDGAFLELGGQWVSPDQTELLSLLGRLGLETFPRYRDGASVYLDDETGAQRFSGEDFPLPEATQREVKRITELLDDLAAEFGADEPWAHPGARALDTISFQNWLERQTDDPRARHLIGMFIAGAMLTKPAHAFSALQAVQMAASAGSFSHLLDDGFILDRRIIGGMQSVCEALAAQLPGPVILNAPVASLRWRGDQVVAETSAGAEVSCRVRARHAVVAVPPPLYSRISFDPPLPARQQQLHQHLSMGLVIKVHAVYSRPFWREKGLSGTGFGVGQLVQEVYDNTNHDDPRGTLVGFVTDETADRVLALPAAERRAKILESLSRYLGPEALSPEVYFESDWASEEWTRGGYAASFDLGGLSRYGADQSQPVGPIHWACSDLAAEGFQHVDGALRMGKQVAQRILSTLGAERGTIE